MRCGKGRVMALGFTPAIPAGAFLAFAPLTVIAGEPAFGPFLGAHYRPFAWA